MNFQASQTNSGDRTEFSIVLAYDQVSARESALTLINFLSKQFDSQTEFQWTQCCFRQLEDNRFSIEATEVAASANMVILATTDGDELPAAVKKWMENWLHRRRVNDGALVATVQQATESPKETRVHSYLSDVAMRAGVRFFAGAF